MKVHSMTAKTLARRRGRSQRSAAPSRVFGYSRVSTAAQAEEGVSLAEQRRQIELRCLAGSNGQPWELAKIFEEKGISGSRALAERPAGRELLSLLQPGDWLICAKLDRLFRDAADAHITIRSFRERGIHLALLDIGGGEDCSGNGVAGLVIGILASVAEWEKGRIRERILEGKVQARLQGKYQGGSRQFGFEEKPDDEGKLVPIPAERAAIELMKAMREADLTLREIAAKLQERGFAISYEGVRRCLARGAEAAGGAA
jgi:putative DNA-invertase from lambdoid prophage Rac